ncbi:MAG: FtsX-like permease family protein, partial [Acidobacteriaceae bacterium]|nr:FtsX-like permease family protein [Acidobacteriaceae bacterium]
LRLRMLAGRRIEAHDREGHPLVAVVNRAFVNRYFPNGGAIGSVLRFATDRAPVRIVGIVENSVQIDPGDTVYPSLLTSYRQFPSREMHLLLRSHPNHDSTAPEVMLTVTSTLDHDLAFARISSLDTLMQEQMAAHRLLTIWVAGFGVLAFALSLVGIYGVISYVSTSRLQEFGIRIALGATSSDILRDVLTRGAYLVVPGVALGVGGAYLASSIVRGVLAKTSATDPPTLIGASALFGVCALAACLIPAARASHVQPVSALRYE